ncbi:MAG: hypothetical protein AAB508_00310, partial [Patescibacteria group bacterium]
MSIISEESEEICNFRSRKIFCGERTKFLKARGDRTNSSFPPKGPERKRGIGKLLNLDERPKRL